MAEKADAVLVVREGYVFTQTYAAHLAENFGLQVFLAVNEKAARRQLDAHPEIIWMLVDNRLPDVNGVERDGLGLAIAEEYAIPTILVTGGPVFTVNNPLVTCVFSIHWEALEAATRWAMARARRQSAARKDEELLAATRNRVREASAELYRELAREQGAPAGFQAYEPIDERYVRNLRFRLKE